MIFMVSPSHSVFDRGVLLLFLGGSQDAPGSQGEPLSVWAVRVIVLTKHVVQLLVVSVRPWVAGRLGGTLRDCGRPWVAG